ncbi:MAG: hypothetical protein AB7S50_06180 [Bacteroidales bacterium]
MKSFLKRKVVLLILLTTMTLLPISSVFKDAKATATYPTLYACKWPYWRTCATNEDGTIVIEGRLVELQD